MRIMTTIGQVTCDTFHRALSEDIHDADSGVTTSMIETTWGALITVERQGQSTSWRVWAYKDGSSKLTHLETPSLPAVDLRFTHGQHLQLRDAVLHFIERGWI